MDIITKNTINELINHSEGLTVSIYMPTYPTGREKEQNPTRFKTQIQKIEGRLSEIGRGANEIEDFLSPLIDLVDDEPLVAVLVTRQHEVHAVSFEQGRQHAAQVTLQVILGT